MLYMVSKQMDAGQHVDDSTNSVHSKWRL